MALIDSEASEILIRLVYDGPPEAGKTTSLRALASSLTRPTYSPAEDGDGRTLWFDWMEYVGGRFEGCQIRCQIVSVAGQRELAARRRRVIAGADVVVFVADSAANETSRTVAYLQELREMLRLTPGSGSEAVAHRLTAHEVPVGVIVQANKRDLPDAIPIKQLRGELENIGWPIGVVESVASEGTGIREAFVYAVRLALDRVREQMHRGGLPTEGNGPRTPEELLRVMRAEDEALHQAPPIVVTPAADSLAAELIRDVLASEAPSEVQEPPADDARLAATPADDVAAEAGAANPPVADPRPEPALAEKAPEPAAPVLLPKLPPLPKPPARGQVTMPPKPPSLTPPHPIPAVIPLVASAVYESQNVPVVAKPRPLEPVDDQWSASLDGELGASAAITWSLSAALKVSGTASLSSIKTGARSRAASSFAGGGIACAGSAGGAGATSGA
ncbi:MAG TPA: hypothetical protein VFP84_15010, partial [Kofleriaceae bacterium]|nr:hypothetical protein [Kofleriaceae bacterium]